ncbi:uncharacterized protein SPPG_00114 [Spizellomyces punctatus DAOM BR117]|uniref:MMS19 nucleotide excision repair protein n=1 Tax=Spizellomyces punctatus (strain DAOM BR117) TaxID=645134 RepID=A0A0L0HTD4_SPIPD|nr:uncharacterized protein SPPG_00114 [Spizellomyces punctatus DAOM BR117]KND04383.1 hypothetical protein SPPG_00114 [Spizellomyces punctatus DAOM BR117]|eukprot:XP_016612422.1 hypothetical protein SPPG_00114 [Spizellomyces punctatus DAOM BR117]
MLHTPTTQSHPNSLNLTIPHLTHLFTSQPTLPPHLKPHIPQILQTLLTHLDSPPHISLLTPLFILHPPTKSMALRKGVLDALVNCIENKCGMEALEALQAFLVDYCEGCEVFEQGALEKVCHILVDSRTEERLRHKCIELLTVYLAPTPPKTTLEKQHTLEAFLGPRFVKRLVKGLESLL